MLDCSVSDVPLCLPPSNSVFAVVNGFQQFIQHFRPLPQRPINHQLTSCIEHVKDEISHRHFPHQLVTHLLTAEPLLQGAEWKGPPLGLRSWYGRGRPYLHSPEFTVVLLGQIAPRQDLSIQNYILRQPSQRIWQLRKRLRD